MNFRTGRESNNIINYFWRSDRFLAIIYLCGLTNLQWDQLGLSPIVLCLRPRNRKRTSNNNIFSLSNGKVLIWGYFEGQSITELNEENHCIRLGFIGIWISQQQTYIFLIILIYLLWSLLWPLKFLLSSIIPQLAKFVLMGMNMEFEICNATHIKFGYKNYSSRNVMRTN